MVWSPYYGRSVTTLEQAMSAVLFYFRCCCLDDVMESWSLPTKWYHIRNTYAIWKYMCSVLCSVEVLYSFRIYASKLSRIIYFGSKFLRCNCLISFCTTTTTTLIIIIIFRSHNLFILYRYLSIYLTRFLVFKFLGDQKLANVLEVVGPLFEFRR
jgi:hypothetical protein